MPGPCPARDTTPGVQGRSASSALRPRPPFHRSRDPRRRGSARNPVRAPAMFGHRRHVRPPQPRLAGRTGGDVDSGCRGSAIYRGTPDHLNADGGRVMPIRDMETSSTMRRFSCPRIPHVPPPGVSSSVSSGNPQMS